MSKLTGGVVASAIKTAFDDDAAGKAGADAAVPKETPLPEIISSFRRLAG